MSDPGPSDRIRVRLGLFGLNKTFYQKMEFIECPFFLAGVLNGNVINWQFSVPSIPDLFQVSHSGQSSQQSHED